MTPDEIIRRGQSAESLLNNTLLNEAFEAILSGLSRDWLVTKRESTIDRDEREGLHARANGVSELRRQLRGWLNDAVAEQAKIERADKRKGVK